MEVVDHFVYSCSVDVVTLLLKMTPSFDYSLPYCWRHSLTHLFNHKSNTLYDGAGILYSSSVLCSWSLHEHAHGVLMSICAHESFMSMLMNLSCACARWGVTRTTTLGQYASGLALVTRHTITVRRCWYWYGDDIMLIMLAWWSPGHHFTMVTIIPITRFHQKSCRTIHTTC